MKQEFGRRWALGAMAAALAAAVAVGTTVGVHVLRDHPDRDSATTALAGAQRSVSYHGLTLQVPRGWGYGAYDGCDHPTRSWVLTATNSTENCTFEALSTTPSRAHTTVFLTTLSARGSTLTSLHLHDVTIGGTPAQRGTGTLAPFVLGTQSGEVEVLVVPRLDAVIAVSSPAARTAEAVLASVRPTADSACPAHLASATPTAGPLIPRAPVGGEVCEYQDDTATPSAGVWLIGRAALSTRELTELTAELRGATTVAAPRPRLDSPVVRYVLDLSGGGTRVLEGALDLDPSPVTDGHRTVAVPLVRTALPDAFTS